MLAWLCVHHGYADELARMMVGGEDSPWGALVLPILEDDLLVAAGRAEDHLLLPDAAWLRLQAARAGDTSQLDRALASYREAGATRYIGEAEKLIAA
jgi:hypothetical protein